MAKHHKEENEILDLIENPALFLSLFIQDNENKEWAVNEIINGGPKHKQIYSALLLQRIHALIQLIEKQTGKKFSVQKGVNISSYKDEVEIPIPLVLTTIKKQNKEEVAEALSHAPAHEIIAFNSLLQAMEWSIALLNKKGL